MIFFLVSLTNLGENGDSGDVMPYVKVLNDRGEQSPTVHEVTQCSAASSE